MCRSIIASRKKTTKCGLWVSFFSKARSVFAWFGHDNGSERDIRGNNDWAFALLGSTYFGGFGRNKNGSCTAYHVLRERGKFSSTMSFVKSIDFKLQDSACHRSSRCFSMKSASRRDQGCSGLPSNPQAANVLTHTIDYLSCLG